MTFKVTKKVLEEFTDVELITTIIRDQRAACSNYHTPLAERLRKIIKRLDDKEITEVVNLTCPRCRRDNLNGHIIMNSYSMTKGHIDVLICNDCGTEESLVLGGFDKTLESLTRQIRWENMKL